jgi:hypothetical protein
VSRSLAAYLCAYLQQQEVVGEVKGTGGVRGKDDEQVSGLVLEPAPPTLPTDGRTSDLHWLIRQPVCRHQGAFH